LTTVLAASSQVPIAVGGIFLLSASLLLVVTRRFGLALALYLIYLGTLDGYLKLALGGQTITLVRTLLLAVIVGASVLASMTDRRTVTWPRGTILVVALVLVALVQIANPGNPNFSKPIGSLRQEIEFVPLFFLAYATVRSEANLQTLLLLLLAVAVANGIANLIQYNLSPAQFASWGPGYKDRIFGANGVSGRVFDDGSLGGRARPFGLGTDAGSGGIAGLLGVGAAIALIVKPRLTSFGSANLVRGIAIAAVPAVLLAVVLSLTRAVLLATVVAILVQALLTARRQLIPLILVGSLVFAGSGFVIQQATSGSTGGNGLARYQSISPGQLLSTTRDQRGDSLLLVATYAARFPFGAGLGGVGPSTGYHGFVRRDEFLNGETQFNVLVLDLGVPGLLLVLAFAGMTLSRVLRIARIPDPVKQAQLAALAGPFAGVITLFVSGSPLTGAPGAPYFWGIAGILAYHLGSRRRLAATTSEYKASWAPRARSQVNGAAASRAAVPMR
jgi:hypothetical protein